MILPRQPGAASPPPTVGSEFGTTPNTKPHARLDGIGIWWLTYAGVWTTLLLAGMAFLYKKRHTPTLRLRGLSLTFAGIILLHLYWITVQIAYSVGPLAPEVAEYWIMGIWYPFGIALFHAGNSQFLHVAKGQSRFARPPGQMKTRSDEKRSRRKATTWLQRIRQMDYSRRMFTFVTLGMTVQLAVVVIIYMVSRKFHPDFGIPGTEVTGSSPMEIAMKQGRGWEWWPSIVWQFIWAWIIAPIILWRSRGIHDTHGWQRQTIACCIAGLPAAPMWLIALYVPGMAPVNQYFVPPQWIALSIFVIEICAVFVPCWQVRKHQALRQETLESIANWESKKCLGTRSEAASDKSSAPPLSPTSTKVGECTGFDTWKKLPEIESSSGNQPSLSGIPDESVLSMAALEHVLDKNPEPLRQFSARRDFSGENIAFLTAVSEWKAALPRDFVRSRHEAAEDGVRQQFTLALRIYCEFISPRDAEFPINIAWHDLRKLQGVFERAARSTAVRTPSSAVDAAIPFADSAFPAHPPAPAASSASTKRNSRDSDIHMLHPSMNRSSLPTPTPTPPPTGNHIPLRATAHQHPSASSTSLSCPATSTGAPPAHTPGYPLYEGDIPQAFDAAVFDAAQASIKYLVLTNTWPKYVRERRGSETSSSAGSSPAGGAGGQSAPSTAGTARTGRSKVSVKVALEFLKGAIH